MVVAGSSVGGYRALGKRHDCDTQVMAWEVTRQSFKCHFYPVCCQQGPVVMCMFKGWLLRKKDFLSLPGKTFFVVLISFHTFLILSPVFLNWNMICCTMIQYQRSELWMWFQRKMKMERESCSLNCYQALLTQLHYAAVVRSLWHFRQALSWTSVGSTGLVKAHQELIG